MAGFTQFDNTLLDHACASESIKPNLPAGKSGHGVVHRTRRPGTDLAKVVAYEVALPYWEISLLLQEGRIEKLDRWLREKERARSHVK